MAILSTLVGSFVGFASFVYSLIFLDYSFMSAMSLYISIGILFATGLIVLTFCARWLANAINVHETLSQEPLRAPVTYYKK